MTVIDFTQALEIKEKAINKIKDNEICIQLPVPACEIPFWTQFLMHSAHSAGYFSQMETNERTMKILTREYVILSDLQVKALMISDIEESEIHISLTYEEVIVLESFLEKYIEECRVFEDIEYMNITSKYLNMIVNVIELNADEFDYMTKYMLKNILQEK
ncbi:hypothetical protein [Bacillus suaedaesalsae]|uniref:Uncharacterized protein n=1 Tax=Bacillus suaedaesalsae TaxID=2810349 RepID=A0ABS2DK04_9BACI|nr:hypothetical protein [Bacillus suaedaesalsae]MBM6618803.1 hypothetical protein [Bacillus suaedaesalsae]